jgi:Putative adhesin
MKTILITLFLCCAAGGLAAQTTLQVATRNIRKTVSWKPGYELIINGEKAEVQISPVDTNAVIITAELSAKHPSLDTASIDLDSWQFLVSTSGKKIYIRAYIGLVNGKNLPLSNMKVKITVLAPKNCPVNLSNKYGKARIEQLDGPVALTGEFCQFQLVNLRGDLDIKSQYGSINGNKLEGKIAVESKRADIHLDSFSADCTIRSEYGQIELGVTPGSGNLTVNGTKSDITLEMNPVTSHNFSLHSAYGTVVAPAGFNTSTSSPDNPRATLQNTTGAPAINLETTFGKIFIKQ